MADPTNGPLTPLPSAVDNRLADTHWPGRMARWATNTATVASFAFQQSGLQRLIYVPLATASVAGAMSAAHYSKVNGWPQIRLNYPGTAADLVNGTALAANTYLTVVGAQNFTVNSTAALLQVEVRLAVQFSAPASLGRYVAEALIDGATVIKLDSQIIAASGAGYLHGAFFHLGGLAAGTHTIALRVRSDVAGATTFLRASTQAMYEYAEIRIFEVSP